MLELRLLAGLYSLLLAVASNSQGRDMVIYLALLAAPVSSLMCEKCGEYTYNGYAMDITDSDGGKQAVCLQPALQPCTGENATCAYYIVTTRFTDNGLSNVDQYTVKACFEGNSTCDPIQESMVREIEKSRVTVVSATCKTMAVCQTDYCNSSSAAQRARLGPAVAALTGCLLWFIFRVV